MTDDKGAAHNKLLAAYPELEDEYAGQDEIPDEIEARLGFLRNGAGKDRCPTVIIDQTEIELAGPIVTLAVYRGYLRPEVKPVEETAIQDAADPALAGQGGDCDLGDGNSSAAHFGIIIMSDGQQLAATCRRMKMTER